MSETGFDVTAPRSVAECYAEELERMVGNYGAYDPQEYPHEAYAVDALRAGAIALRQQQTQEDARSDQSATPEADPRDGEWTARDWRNRMLFVFMDNSSQAREMSDDALVAELCRLADLSSAGRIALAMCERISRGGWVSSELETVREVMALTDGKATK